MFERNQLVQVWMHGMYKFSDALSKTAIISPNYKNFAQKHNKHEK